MYGYCNRLRQEHILSKPFLLLPPAATLLNRTELLENYELPMQFSLVPATRTGLHDVSRQCYKQDAWTTNAVVAAYSSASTFRSTQNVVADEHKF